MHMLFQSEAASRRRRYWTPQSGDAAGAAVATALVPIGPQRQQRGRSRNCKTARREAKAAKRRAQRQQKSEPEVERDSDREEDNQDEEEQAEDDEGRIALRDEVLAMQMEIETLQRRRLLLDSALINAHTNAVGDAIDLTKSFYVHFSNGFDTVNHPAQATQAERFLRGIMRTDVLCTEFRGVDLFLSQYKMCTEGHASMRVFVHDILAINEDLSSREGAIQILAKATARFRVSRKTLEKFFPRIIEDEALAQQLIGKEYAIQYDKVFHFKHGRVFQHESQVDFCNSMLEMAQDPFVAMKLLEASLMTKHGHLKVDGSIEEDKNQLENTVL